MKKILFPIAIFVLLFSACSSDDFINEIEEHSGPINAATMTVADFEGDALATPTTLRTTISADGSFLWARGDKVGVWPTLEEGEEPTASQVLFTVQEGAGTKSATFTGSGWGLLHNRTYYAYFPYNEEGMSNCITNTYQSGLTQMFNNTTFHLSANDFMYASATTPAEGNSANFQFHHLGSLMRIVVNLPAAASTTVFKTASISVAGGKSLFPLQVTYNPSSTEPVEQVVTKTSTLSLTLGLNGNGFKPTANTITLWFLTGATDLTGQNIYVNLSNATTTYSGVFAGANQLPGHARSYTTTATEGTIGEDFVDMGTDVLWARCNLGATSQEHFGDYYAWGETTPHYTSLTMAETGSSPKVSSVTWKVNSVGYTWANYFDTSDAGKTFKKYNKSKMVLEPADDAAHVVLGGNWRMPTTEEVMALFAVSTLKSATVGGVRGVTFTSTITGNSIFIPGNGYFSGADYNCSSNGFRLWTSTNKSTTLGYGWHCVYSSPTDGFKQYDRDRLRGYGIRPVYNPDI